MQLFESASVPSQHDLPSCEMPLGDSTLQNEACVPQIPQLVLLLGSPRSGTTYLAKLLDCDPSIGYLHEPLSKGRGLLIHRALGMVACGEPVDKQFIHNLTSDLVKHLPQFSKPPFFAKQFELFPFAIACAWFLHRYLKVCIQRTNCILNTKHLRMLLLKDGLAPSSRLLCDALQARMILILRHPCGVVNSMLRGEHIGAMGSISPRGLWTSANGMLSRFGYKEDDIDKMQPDELHAVRWLIENYPVLAWLGSPNIYAITFSQLIRDCKTTYSALCAWLNVPIHTSTLRRAENLQRSFTERIRCLLSPRFRYYSVVPRRNDLDAAWQHELPAESIRRILRVVRPFPLERFWPQFAQ